MPPMPTTRSSFARQLIAGEIRALHWRYPAFLALTLVVALAELLPPKLFIFFTSSLPELTPLAKLATTDFLRDLLLFGALVAGCTFVANASLIIGEEWICLSLEGNLRRRALTAIHEAPLAAIDGAQRGDWMIRMSGDLRSAEQFLAVTAPGYVQRALIVVAVTGILCWRSIAIALVLVASASALAVINVLVQRRTQPVLDDLRQMHSHIFQMLLDNYEGIATIRSLGAQAQMRAEFSARVGQIMTTSLRVMRLIGLLIGSNAFASNALITVCLSGVAWSMVRGELTLADAVAVPFYISLFYGAALRLTGAALDWSRFTAEAGRLGELLAPVAASPYTGVTWTGPLQARQPKLQMQALTFGYDANEPLTERFDFALSKGDIVLVQGPSGCGKSTFLQVLAGLRPALSGWAEGGEADALRPLGDSRLWPQRPLLPCPWSTYVEQRPFLFEASVRTNLLLGSAAGCRDEQLWAALEQVNMAPHIQAMGGLDAVLADAGKNLSEGQKYRLALARALLQDRPFLLLDEPFAALDPVSIEVIIKALNAASERCGLVVVSHVRPAALACTRVLDFARLGQVPAREAAAPSPGHSFALTWSVKGPHGIASSPGASTPIQLN